MEDDRELLEGLRALAADGPQSAPDRVEWRLRAEFRNRNRRRRARVWSSFGAAAALAAGLAVFVWVREVPKSAAAPAVAPVAAATVAADADEDPEANFYPLPEAEALPAAESAVVVQVQLPAASLRLMGVPLDEEADSPVQAELLLGQDGLARGVRLVQ
jgi:hypothetical protein